MALLLLFLFIYFFNSFIGILLSYNSNKKINKFNTVEMAKRE